MTTSAVSNLQIQEFLLEISPFDRLSEKGLRDILPQCQLLSYRTGQPIFERDKLPTQVAVIYQGQARLLAYDSRSQRHTSLQLLGAKEILGWAGLLRGVPCETVIASTEMICISIPAAVFMKLMEKEPQFAEAFRDHAAISEVFELLSQNLQQVANSGGNIKEMTKEYWPDAIVVNLLNGQTKGSDLKFRLDANRLWLVSSGVVGDYSVGNGINLETLGKSLKVEGPRGARLVGLRTAPTRTEVVSEEDTSKDGLKALLPNVIPAPETPPEPELDSSQQIQRFPLVRGRGTVDAPLACFNMLSKHFRVNFRKELIRRIIEGQLETAGSLTLQACGAIAQMMGITAQLVQVPSKALCRLKAPAMIPWRNSFAIIYSISEKQLIMASPEEGVVKMRPGQFVEVYGEACQVLLLQETKGDQQEQFSFWWFVPAIMEHRGVFVEVLLSSFFVQLFGLVNPLLTMIIIDKVMGQRNIDALNILAFLMLGVALFEALLSALRTYLFVDTTNRLDVKLSSEVIDHLLRLPLNYFDNRKVGDLMARVGELSNIRNFLTGTALTVVLDAVFSVVYVAVMFYLNVTMALVALAPLPLFALIIIINSPIIQRLLRRKAELYGHSQAYLVEVLNGMQTVKGSKY
ncbi:cyclic nucleotide-binding protein [Limnospira maxima CS-328]|uniref:Cyclic nucleotide-binding protein n=1 Tax=Limnospira maxima CS-328 TaxID=513049 RepID=B5W9D5_LIMMA|nr:ABC transporter transmembrane domain-containing protein [Limnospira maxima]EDZ91851.1 cyclic nucleotide-binding protein [Limnospira maxima CS-328]